MRRRRSSFLSLPAAFAVVLAAATFTEPLRAADLVQGVRSKLSAADLSSGEAAVEVEGRLRLDAEGRGGSIRFLEGELSRAKDPALRSRIRKNLNVLTLEGESELARRIEILIAE